MYPIDNANGSRMVVISKNSFSFIVPSSFSGLTTHKIHSHFLIPTLTTLLTCFATNPGLCLHIMVNI